MRGNLIVACALLALAAAPACNAAGQQKTPPSQPAQTGSMYNGNNAQAPKFRDNKAPSAARAPGSNAAAATGADTSTSGGSGARQGGGG